MTGSCIGAFARQVPSAEFLAEAEESKIQHIANHVPFYLDNLSRKGRGLLINGLHDEALVARFVKGLYIG